MLVAYEDKSAEAVCTFAFSEGPGHEPKIFQGRTKVQSVYMASWTWLMNNNQGRIVPARGPAVFGWDAVFEYEGQTYAEMDRDMKNTVSHRGKALDKLKAWLASGEQAHTEL